MGRDRTGRRAIGGIALVIGTAAGFVAPAGCSSERSPTQLVDAAMLRREDLPSTIVDPSPPFEDSAPMPCDDADALGLPSSGRRDDATSDPLAGDARSVRPTHRITVRTIAAVYADAAAASEAARAVDEQAIARCLAGEQSAGPPPSVEPYSIRSRLGPAVRSFRSEYPSGYDNSVRFIASARPVGRTVLVVEVHVDGQNPSDAATISRELLGHVLRTISPRLRGD